MIQTRIISETSKSSTDRAAEGDAAVGEGGGEAAAAAVSLGPGEGEGAVDQRSTVGVNEGRPVKEA